MASYSQPFELYGVDVVDVVFTLLCHTSTNVIEFLFLCAIQFFCSLSFEFVLARSQNTSRPKKWTLQ